MELAEQAEREVETANEKEDNAGYYDFSKWHEKEDNAGYYDFSKWHASN